MLHLLFRWQKALQNLQKIQQRAFTTTIFTNFSVTYTLISKAYRT